MTCKMTPFVMFFGLCVVLFSQGCATSSQGLARQSSALTMTRACGEDCSMGLKMPKGSSCSTGSECFSGVCQKNRTCAPARIGGACRTNLDCDSRTSMCAAGIKACVMIPGAKVDAAKASQCSSGHRYTQNQAGGVCDLGGVGAVCTGIAMNGATQFMDAYCMSRQCNRLTGTCDKGVAATYCRADADCLSGSCAHGVCTRPRAK